MATRKTKAAPAATTKPAEASSDQGASLLQTGADHAGDAMADGQAGADSPEATQDQIAAAAPAHREREKAVAAAVARAGETRRILLTEGVAAIAMVCHEVNRAYCEAIGDGSQLPWADAAEWQRDSAVKGVEFKLANLDATPEQQHNAWCSDKIRQGWAYGPKKDEVARTHHCLVPYSALPLEQRVKDHLFGAVVRSMSGLGMSHAPVSKAAGS